MKGSTLRRGRTWTAYWSTTDPATGKRRQHSKGGFRTQREARGYLNGIMEKVVQGSWHADAKMTVAELLNDWLAAKRSEGVRANTVSLYKTVVSGWVLPHIGGLDVRQLTPVVVGNLVEELRARGSRLGRGGLSARSVQLAVTVLKAATSWAVRTGLLSRDPLLGYKRPRASSKPMTSWSTEEARAFLATVKDDRLSFAWVMLLTRGLRRGELCGLRWDDIDLDGSVVRVNRARVIIDGQPVESAPKTALGRRAVPLDPGLVRLLKAHRARQAAEKLAAGPAYEDGGLLVADELGQPLYPDTISERFAELTKAAELRPIRLHDTRHTAASLMLASGVPLKVVAEMLGHDPKMTLATYAHVTPGMAGEAGAALSKLLLGEDW